MSDHIPDTGKMVPDEVVMLRTIAAILDHPNVYMGGPSQRNMRRAEDILAAVAPTIAAAERERCARVAERLADSWAADWRAGIKANSHLEGKSDGGDEIAAAIRALGDADG